MGGLSVRWASVFFIVALAQLSLAGSALSQQPQGDASGNATLAQIRALHWTKTGTIKLGLSSSSVVIPQGFDGVVDDEARKFDELANGTRDEYTESVLVDDSNNTVYFEFHDSGYVTIDDWQDLDPKVLIDDVTENTEKANEERRAKGIRPLHVNGWVQEPSFDRTTKTVFWAFSATEEGGDAIVNSIALRLGRSGYEKLIWVSERDAYKPTGGVLDAMLRAHSFDPGQRYEDHKEGDKLAGYGIAALVGAVVGAKLVKIGAFAALLLFAKKVWFLAFAAVAIFYKKIKSLFTSRPDAPTG